MVTNLWKREWVSIQYLLWVQTLPGIWNWLILKNMELMLKTPNFPTAHEEHSLHTVILPNWTLKKWGLSNLPSSIARNSSAPNAKIIFEILWGILEGLTVHRGAFCQFLIYIDMIIKMPICQYLKNKPKLLESSLYKSSRLVAEVILAPLIES